jgi:hypothetical protein
MTVHKLQIMRAGLCGKRNSVYYSDEDDKELKALPSHF